jgi:predicted negative regulator of RcsB-dependent stress response
VLLARGDRAGALDIWRKADAAAAADPGTAAQVDAELLRLKIDELSASQGAK